MAGRGQNQPQPQPLQGADPALVQILQMMQNRDANRDNSRKQFFDVSQRMFLLAKIRNLQKTIGPSFQSTLIIKTNKVPSHVI